MLNLIRWMMVMMVLVMVMIIAVADAQAQASRTWVSGVGDDVNPCSRTAPCKTFAGAISKTAAGGEIDALDPGGFGAVTITKSITIDGGGNIAGVLVSGTNGIVVAAGAGDRVILRNLDINGISAGLNGIRFISGDMLFVENSTIYGFTQYGIDFEPSAGSFLSVSRTMIRNAALGALLVKPGALGAASATVVDSYFEHSQFGVRAEDRAAVAINGSVADSNAANGFIAASGGGTVQMELEKCVSAGNSSYGVVASGGGATIHISNTNITHNTTGVGALSGGSVVSFGNNRITDNTTNGGPTSTIGQQ